MNPNPQNNIDSINMNPKADSNCILNSYPLIKNSMTNADIMKKTMENMPPDAEFMLSVTPNIDVEFIIPFML